MSLIDGELRPVWRSMFACARFFFWQRCAISLIHVCNQRNARPNARLHRFEHFWLLIAVKPSSMTSFCSSKDVINFQIWSFFPPRNISTFPLSIISSRPKCKNRFLHLLSVSLPLSVCLCLFICVCLSFWLYLLCFCGNSRNFPTKRTSRLRLHKGYTS